jgi:hypothetical protein
MLRPPPASGRPHRFTVTVVVGSEMTASVSPLANDAPTGAASSPTPVRWPRFGFLPVALTPVSAPRTAPGPPTTAIPASTTRARGARALTKASADATRRGPGARLLWPSILVDEPLSGPMTSSRPGCRGLPALAHDLPAGYERASLRAQHDGTTDRGCEPCEPGLRGGGSMAPARRATGPSAHGISAMWTS